MAVALMSILLAASLTFVVADIYTPYVPALLAWVIHLVVCAILYRIVSAYLGKLKE